MLMANRRLKIKGIAIVGILLITFGLSSRYIFDINRNNFSPTVYDNSISNSDIQKPVFKVEDKEVISIDLKEYYILELDKFGVKNDGTSPIETSKGINTALKYAKEQGFRKVIMPKGLYLISEKEPIIMLSELTIDLNGSTFKIKPHGEQKSLVINFEDSKNASLINGVILGDKNEHDYDSIKGSHEWNCGIVFNESESCEINNIIVKDFPGYGISSSLGKNISNLTTGVTVSNLEKGGINNQGKLNNVSGTIRTKQPMDIRQVGGEFELGYNKGYMGYPYMIAKMFESYFYDKDMKFLLSENSCQQYKKVKFPQDAAYVHFVFHQSDIPTKGDTDFNNTTVFVTNYKSPSKIRIANCSIEGNKSLGMGFCGGRDFVIENNTFIKNGGGTPGYAVDLEDGWEYMDKYIFINNKFIDNTNDVVICAGDNIIFENNDFTSTVYMWGRATNYKFIDNKFTNIKMGVTYEYSTDTVSTGNTYTNTNITLPRRINKGKFIFEEERLNNTSINDMGNNTELKNSIITSDNDIPVRLAGVYKNCIISIKKGELISAKLINSKIEGVNINCQGDTVFESCEFNNSINNTTSNTGIINVNNSILKDSKFVISTWGSKSSVNIRNSQVSMSAASNSFIAVSAGKLTSLEFKNNRVTNNSNSAVFNIYDTTYSQPDASLLICDSSFEQDSYPYILDGVDLDRGIIKLSSEKNIIKKGEMLSIRYNNNKNFKIN